MVVGIVNSLLLAALVWGGLRLGRSRLESLRRGAGTLIADFPMTCACGYELLDTRTGHAQFTSARFGTTGVGHDGAQWVHRLHSCRSVADPTGGLQWTGGRFPRQRHRP